MKLEEQVVSLELSKRLKELGVKQESAFYYEELFTKEQGVLESNFVQKKRYDGESGARYFAAFTVAELGRMIPVIFRKKISSYHLYDADELARKAINLIEQGVVKP